MKILLDIGHPKDINLFRNVVPILRTRGHDIKIFARLKENSRQLLDDLNVEYNSCKHYKSMIGKCFGLFANDLLLYNKAKKYKPDVFVSPGSPYSAHVSKLLGKPHIAFSDTEIAGLVTKLTLPFTEKIFTSTSFYLDLGPKHEKFKGYYELAYLNPKYFTPDEEVIHKYGLDTNYIVMRLSTLSSHHDINAKGFGFNSEIETESYIEEFENHGNVLIFKENTPYSIYRKNKIYINPTDFHSILYFARLFIGDGASMASEAAVLGVPSIYVSNTRRGYLNELETKYDLVYTIEDRKTALYKAKELLSDPQLNIKWKFKKDKMLDETVDVVEFIVEKIESFNK